jgi:hypothetical protein
VFRFTRLAAYDILHVAMNVSRQNPLFERRPPNSVLASAEAAYRTVATKIFERDATFATPHLAADTELRPSLERIRREETTTLTPSQRPSHERQPIGFGHDSYVRYDAYATAQSYLR